MSIEWRRTYDEWAGYVGGNRYGSVWYFSPGTGEWRGFIMLSALELGAGNYGVKVSVNRDNPEDVMKELDRLYEKFKTAMKEVKVPAHE